MTLPCIPYLGWIEGCYNNLTPLERVPSFIPFIVILVVAYITYKIVSRRHK